MTQIAQLKKKKKKKKVVLLFFNWNHLLFHFFPAKTKKFKLWSRCHLYITQKVSALNFGWKGVRRHCSWYTRYHHCY